MLGIETFFLFIGLLPSSTCNYITTTRGITGYILVVSITLMPIFIGASIWIVNLVNIFRGKNNLEKITMEPILVEMSYASAERVIDFYEDFYAVTIVSYIYY